MARQITLNNLEQPVVQLEQADYDNCVEVTEKILEYARRNGHKNSYGMNPAQNWAYDFCGALGEQAIAHYFNFDYTYNGYDPAATDVLGYQVRATYYGNGSLLTHPIKTSENNRGDNAGRYILVTIDPTTLSATIRGYSTLTRCNERAENWTTQINGKPVRWPCYFMPQAQLWPIDMLPASQELINHQTRKKN
jgi:hypothetical protein